MALVAEAEGLVGASCQEVLEFVLDLDAYRQIDPKITKVVRVGAPDADGRGQVRMWGKLPGLPPAPDSHDYVLERWERVTFTGAARQPGRLIFDFTGIIECEPEDEQTRVVHRYRFEFKGPFQRVEARLNEWLQAQVEDEVAALAAHFGGS